MTPDSAPRFRAVGSAAVLVELADLEAAQATYRRVRRLAADPRSGLQSPRDVVPAARTVLLDGLADVAAWMQALSDVTEANADPVPGVGEGTEVVLAIRYDGPDLDAVAGAWACSTEAVTHRHAAATYRVAFCGFAPGFAYCTSEPRAPDVPRRDDPRGSVPAGSVGLGGRYCGVYPRTMPGGWQLVGTTDAVLFDPGRPQPALLNPGDRVRFRPVG
jgi:KipI family sensor histidine kinase inhibitor